MLNFTDKFSAEDFVHRKDEQKKGCTEATKIFGHHSELK